MQRHLAMVLYKTGEDLTKMDKLDLDLAKATASKQVKINLRKKVTDQDLDHWMDLAGDLVGTHPDLQKQTNEPMEKKIKMDNDAKQTTEAKQPTEKPSEATKKLATNKPIKRIKYAALIQRLKRLRLQNKTKGRQETVVPETQQEPVIENHEVEEDDEIPSFQKPREDEEPIDWDTNFPVLQISQDDGQDPTTSRTKQAKANKLKKKNFKNNIKN